MLICVYTICFVSRYHQAILQQHIDASRAHTLRAKHVTLSSCKYFPYTSTLNSKLCDILTGWYSTRRCDCTVSCTQKQVCYLTVHDCYRVFLLRMMYEGVEMAVINLVLHVWSSESLADGLCLAMHECLFHWHCCICMYMHFSTPGPINVRTVIVSFVNN